MFLTALFLTMRRLISAALFFSLAFSALAQGSLDEIQTATERFLRATAYVASLKDGIVTEKIRSGKTTPLLEFILRMNDPLLETHIAAVLSRYLTLEQAVTAATFYESGTGRAIVAAQWANPDARQPPIGLSKDQELEYAKFADSGIEAAVARVTSDRGIWDEILAELDRARRMDGK